MAHNHSHHQTTVNYGRVFAIGIGLNLAYVAVEAGFGFWNGSLALLSDAGHNLSDVVGLLLAWGGHALSRFTPTTRHTYGWGGSTILAALFNALILLAAVGAIVLEAVQRLITPAPVGGPTIAVVALVGVVVNTVTALLFVAGSKHDLNLRGALLHMAADAAVSLGVVIAGLAIWYTGAQWIDPVTSLLVAAVVFFATWGLLKESVNLSIQAVPQGIDPVEVARFLAQVDGVASIHDLHIWAMSTTQNALTVHLVTPDLERTDPFLHQLKHDLHDRFGIDHMTVQIEHGVGPGCDQAEACL
ncbi:Cadmium, cobalt and zinc/H(+)-K(+) antiporter [Pirellulimonas nuda]|uniref:Cadmium, cobalt and zinc/H(+)-K(+) antiporter n=1 Tax=Pirellulimonas nuda TaxID=2528009 RepID=A0A518D5R3_9BACT|nr:cation diffusion facilitator family transporter [Pirellulimonas nuda]QDU86800.1 Cadmium, cobalt and zinc/H(+)-K(+) antiporter [Pirellulimonas nuda]